MLHHSIYSEFTFDGVVVANLRWKTALASGRAKDICHSSRHGYIPVVDT